MSTLKDSWEIEKGFLTKLKEKKNELENLKLSQEEAEREANYERVAKIRYQEIPEIETEIENLNTELKNIPQRLLREEVDAELIASIVSKWTRIPVEKMMEKEMDKLIHLEKEIGQKVMGQKEAIISVSEAIRRARSGLSDPNRPIGSFLFLGPTGVGKTELTKCLAETLFDSKEAMIRLDMSEYMEKHTVAKLIGSPPGYVGHEEGGILTEALRTKPYTVVLFDEVEKSTS